MLLHPRQLMAPAFLCSLWSLEWVGLVWVLQEKAVWRLLWFLQAARRSITSAWWGTRSLLGSLMCVLCVSWAGAGRDQQQQKCSAQVTLMPQLCMGDSYLGAQQHQRGQSRTESLSLVLKLTKPRQGKSCVSYGAGLCHSRESKSIVNLSDWYALYLQVSPANHRTGKNIQLFLLCQS